MELHNLTSSVMLFLRQPLVAHFIITVTHRGRRGAPQTRRDDREYREYLREEQRNQRGCIAGRMQLEFHRGLPGSARWWQARARGGRDGRAASWRFPIQTTCTIGRDGSRRRKCSDAFDSDMVDFVCVTSSGRDVTFTLRPFDFLADGQS